MIIEKRKLQALGLATARHDVQGIADIRRELDNLGKSDGESQLASGEATNEEKKQPDETIIQNVPSPPGNVLTPTLPEVLRMTCYPANNAAPYEVSYNVRTRIGSITNGRQPRSNTTPTVSRTTRAWMCFM
jgi:hypothetical protein